MIDKQATFGEIIAVSHRVVIPAGTTFYNLMTKTLTIPVSSAYETIYELVGVTGYVEAGIAPKQLYATFSIYFDNDLYWRGGGIVQFSSPAITTAAIFIPVRKILLTSGVYSLKGEIGGEFFQVDTGYLGWIFNFNVYVR